MKNITEFILEGQINNDTIIKPWDANTDFLNYLATNLNIDRSLFSISGDGIKYKRILVPDTKLSTKPTAGELLEKVLSFVETNDAAATKKGKVKKLRKNFGVPRGSYGAKERMDARELERNRRISRGLPLDDAEIYKG